MTKRGMIGLGVTAGIFAVVSVLPKLLRHEYSAVLEIAIAWSFATAGSIAWIQRPDSATGRALLAISALWSLSLFRSYDVPVLWTIAQLNSNLWVIGLVYLLLVFPGSRLRSSGERFLVASAVFLGVVLDDLVAIPLLDCRSAGFATPDCDGLNLVHVDGYAALGKGAHHLAQLGAVFLIGALVVVCRRNWRQTTAVRRRASAPLTSTALVTISAFVAMAILIEHVDFFRHRADLLWDIGGFAFMTVPFGLLVGVLRSRARRARVGDLIVELGQLPDPDRLEYTLRKALEDPSLLAGVWVPEKQRYLRPTGDVLELPAEGSDQVATFLDRGGEPLAVLVHDRALLDEGSLVESVKMATRLAVENQRLQGELIAQLVEIQASRARIVESADEARRQIERDLHDGLQQRLVALAVSLGLLADEVPALDEQQTEERLQALKQDAKNAISELREAARGVHPAILSEQGLSAALQNLADRAGIAVDLRLSTHLDELPLSVATTTYFICAEGISNSIKHGHAAKVAIEVIVSGGDLSLHVSDDGVGGAAPQAGGGLRGLADRVAAVGGTLDISSPSGRGTRLVATLPLEQSMPSAIPGTEQTGRLPSFRWPSPTFPTAREGNQVAPLLPLVSVQGVVLEYLGARALDNICLTLARGETLGVLGTNGAGKSSLLRVIAGLDPPTSGMVVFDGEDVTYEPAEVRSRRGIAYVPADAGVFPNLTVAENLDLFTRDDRGRAGGARVQPVFDRFPFLYDRRKQSAGLLSRGQQRMLALSKALVSDPRLLLIDELTVGLASGLIDEALGLLESISREGISIVFVDQRLGPALQIATNAVFLDEGRCVYRGTPAGLYEREDLFRPTLVQELVRGMGG